MKTTLYAAVAALALAFAPLAFAAEGSGDPFALHLPSIATTHFTNGVMDQTSAAATLPAAAPAPAYGQPVAGQPDGLAAGAIGLAPRG